MQTCMCEGLFLGRFDLISRSIDLSIPRCKIFLVYISRGRRLTLPYMYVGCILGTEGGRVVEDVPKEYQYQVSCPKATSPMPMPVAATGGDGRLGQT